MKTPGCGHLPDGLLSSQPASVPPALGVPSPLTASLPLPQLPLQKKKQGWNRTKRPRKTLHLAPESVPCPPPKHPPFSASPKQSLTEDLNPLPLWGGTELLHHPSLQRGAQVAGDPDEHEQDGLGGDESLTRSEMGEPHKNRGGHADQLKSPK